MGMYYEITTIDEQIHIHAQREPIEFPDWQFLNVLQMLIG